MNILEAIKKRSSTRAFLEKDVSKAIIESILETARWAPSGTNTQPWNVVVLSGSAKEHLCEKMAAKFTAHEKGTPDYHYYTAGKLVEPYRTRRFNCGMALYGALGIGREDRVEREASWSRNYHAFNAPVMLLFFIDKCLEKGSWLDYGMFLENVMLAALEYGLATCPQQALAEYPDLARDYLGEDYQDKILICGIALGYADTRAAINNYRTEREDIANFTRWCIEE